MEELEKLEDERRSQYGSVNPSAIIGPAIAATIISTLVAVIFCKLMQEKRNTARQKK